jgi:hypothetical protein
VLQYAARELLNRTSRESNQRARKCDGDDSHRLPLLQGASHIAPVAIGVRVRVRARVRVRSRVNVPVSFAPFKKRPIAPGAVDSHERMQMNRGKNKE